MSSKQTTADFLLEQMSLASNIRFKKMFGEYAIYSNEKVVAFICDNNLYVKITSAGREVLGDTAEGQPYPNARPHFLISEDLWENRHLISKLISATEKELPPPKPKKKSLKINTVTKS